MHSSVAATTQNVSVPILTAGSLDDYLRSICQIPVLGALEEAELARRMRDQHDVSAARRLALSNLRFVAHVARSYLAYGLPFGDLIQQGNVGLLKALSRYEPSRAVRVITFAVQWIKSEIHEFILRNWRIVRIATTKAQRKLFFGLRRRMSHVGCLNVDEAEAIAKDLDVSKDEVLRMEARFAARDLAVDKFETDDDAGRLQLRSHEDASTELERDEWNSLRLAGLHRALMQLDDRSRDIVRRRLLCEGSPAGLLELGREYGVSAERIRQIQNNALARMRVVLQGSGITGAFDDQRT